MSGHIDDTAQALLEPLMDRFKRAARADASLNKVISWFQHFSLLLLLDSFGSVFSFQTLAAGKQQSLAHHGDSTPSI
jgi:hypothetical protein